MVGQPELARDGAYLGLVQLAEREAHTVESLALDRSAEVALILVVIDSTVKARAVGGFLETCVVPGGNEVRSQAPGVRQEGGELDRPVAEDVRIRRAPARVGCEKVAKNLLVIGFGEIDALQWDFQFLRDGARSECPPSFGLVFGISPGGTNILGVLFFFTVTPIALVLRVLGKDPLNRRFDSAAKSYWIERDSSDLTPESMRQQF